LEKETNIFCSVINKKIPGNEPSKITGWPGFTGTKIVITGPESTGKSTLCESLALHYNTVSVKEYAREFLLKHGTNYTYEDLLSIAKGQLELEEAAIRTAMDAGQNMIILDTDMYVMKVWCEFVFGNCHPFILEQIKKRKYDLYLLCQPDLPWVKDELREYPDLETREKLFHLYKAILENQAVPFVIINGPYEERFKKAVSAIDQLSHK
jgi:NadR type nicotinamide-nucleotide adenylyltransferase